MKVLHILNELSYSGAEVLLHSGKDYFQSVGANTVLSTGENVGPYAPVLAAAGYGIEHLAFSKSLIFFLRLANFVHAGGYDVIHLHTERSALWYGLVARALGRPVIRTIHNEFSFEGNLRWRRKLGRQLLSWLGVRHIACSERVARNERSRFGIDCATISNWIAPSRIDKVTLAGRLLARQKLGIESESFVLVSLANFGPAKNQEAIIAAIRRLATSLPVLYLHCGGNFAALKEKMSVGDAEAFIRFCGPIDDVRHHLLAADAFVSTSFYEGGQVSLLEAAASGVPCITTNVGLAEELSGLPGVYFIDPTAESLEQSALRLSKIPLSERLALSGALNACILEHYVPSVGAQQYADTYRKMAKLA